MAKFEMKEQYPAIHMLTRNTDEVVEVVNNTNEVYYLGVVVEITRGNAKIEHIDIDFENPTFVEVKPGETAQVDPTGVNGAVGVGTISPSKITHGTAGTLVSSEVSTPRRKTKGK